jgi:hypothetical protein
MGSFQRFTSLVSTNFCPVANAMRNNLTNCARAQLLLRRLKSTDERTAGNTLVKFRSAGKALLSFLVVLIPSAL